jgi:hypothetical protein
MDYDTLRDMYEPGDPKLYSLLHGADSGVDYSFFGPDPDLAMVKADMAVYHEAHPCECEALCVCEGGQA